MIKMKVRYTDVSACKQFVGQWIAFDSKSKKIVGHGKRITEAKEMADRSATIDPVFRYIPKNLRRI